MLDKSFLDKPMNVSFIYIHAMNYLQLASRQFFTKVALEAMALSESGAFLIVLFFYWSG